MFPKQWQAATKVIRIIEQAGFEAYIVGGAVRDFYLDKKNADVDIATSALPAEIQAIFSQTIDVGIEHGTVLVLDCGEPIEVTTYRTESTYTDHRRPDEVQFVRNLEEDLKRRDFTMNAMALSQTGDYIDLFNGRADIDAKIIRAVGNPSERFKEDALRMLRAIRFAAQLGFAIEEQTLQAIKEQSRSISYIALERIQIELSKAWTSNYVYRAIEYIEQTGLAASLDGEFNALDWKNFNSSDRQVGWAYFCFVNNLDTTLLTRYRLSNKDKQFTKQVIEAYTCMQTGLQAIDYLRFDLYILQTAYQFTIWKKEVPLITYEEIERKKKALPIQHQKELALTGKDVLDWSERKRGPWIKTVLDAALLAVLDGKIANDKQQLKEWFHAFNDEG
ncbi:CCA tRNA nucleotidyltransferase [Lysinibacillus sp. 2017]|uniref:CCA tRNA nucleotidyltransferase n=1 Tax=unclassified Lysinibacillus TaxID=2636778 RepID=UPI000D529BF2|nr:MULTISPECIES: CCA tRNA nucleotidyltransferase [unclassified Lysinibacillus]AWE07012.1 CCA tRNA nucleotidyltransferase [Lysinibacillus sp. 2017]TGN37065.1 CCA tRNA nucleotidyltransferase [Lysinibacillus sp. S2017]